MSFSAAVTAPKFDGSVRYVGNRFLFPDDAMTSLAYTTADVYTFVDIPGRDLLRAEIENLRLGFRVRKLTNVVYAQWAESTYQDQVLLGAPRTYEVWASARWQAAASCAAIAARGAAQANVTLQLTVSAAMKAIHYSFLNSGANARRSALARVRFVVHQGVIDGDRTRESRYGEARGQLSARPEERREKLGMRPFGRLFSEQRNPREHLNARKGAFDYTMRALL